MRIRYVPENDSLKAKLKAKLKNAGEATREWLDEHGDEVVEAAPFVIVGTIFTVKFVSAVRKTAADTNFKDLYVYDNRLGHYWKLRRCLKNSEWLEIERRKKLGESMGEILRNMRVI